jgi:membrane protease YdiL (CAAX protease family)
MTLADRLNIALMIAGAAILLAALSVVVSRKRWRAALSCVPVRTRELDLIHVALLVLFFILVLGGLNALGRAIGPPAGLTEELWIGDPDVPGLWPIVANNAAKLATVALACLTVVLLVRGGLRTFGLRGTTIRWDVLWGVAAYLVIWPICAGIAQLFVLLTGKPPTHGVLNLLHSGDVPGWGVAALWISAVFVSPIAEEVFFRGVLQTVIRGYADRPWLAIAVASVLFGLMHYTQPQYVVPLALLGLVLGYVYEHTGSLIACILIHILFNSRTMLLDLLMRSM